MKIFSFVVLFVWCFVVVGVPPSVAQNTEDPHAVETKAQVPALSRFHTPIYQLWHTAWPSKDTAFMASLWPEIAKGVADVAGAELPGILRDKKAVWQENVAHLQKIAGEYESSMRGTELQPKLDAAEKLHAQYERLVRIIRPVLKEIEQFHTVLYMLYHYYMPGYQIEKIRESVAQLQEKVKVLGTAKLPERLKNRGETFAAARTKLAASVQKLADVVAGENEKMIKDAVHVMHADYVALEKVFE